MGAHLEATDVVGTTFYIAANMMLAFSVFFFLERGHVAKHWGTSITAAGIVTFIAFYNYIFMRDMWVETKQSPTVYRYTDWLITVPVLVLEFALVLQACGAQTGNLTSRLLLASLVMLGTGYMGEAGMADVTLMFMISCASMAYIVYEVFAGDAAKTAEKLATGAGKQAFETMRLIVAIGWLIYPAGYALGYFGSGGGNTDALNMTYNLADLINKGGYGMVIWAAAKAEGSA